MAPAIGSSGGRAASRGTSAFAPPSSAQSDPARRRLTRPEDAPSRTQRRRTKARQTVRYKLTMHLPATFDEIDRQILDLLVDDARRSVADISKHVSLSAAPVQRRITRLEQAGVIRGYTTVIDHDLTGPSIEAFIELRLTGDGDVDSIVAGFESLPEIRASFTVAGDPDVLVRIRVEDVEHLKRIVNALRRVENVRGTKTLMVLDTWSRASS